MEEAMKYSNDFFENSKFFDNNVKKKIEKNSNLKFEDLIDWCYEKCYTKSNKFNVIGNKTYVRFFLFSIYRHKEILEELWIPVADIMDYSFKIRMIDNQIQFKQYLWELYLKNYFVKKGKKIEKNNKNSGPDIFFEDHNEKIYIECIVPNVGNNYFKVPQMNFDGIDEVPFEELKQRLKYGLLAKIEKYIKYIENNTVLKNDKLLIAINTSALSTYGNIMDYSEPLILEVCKEIGLFENYPFIDGIIYSHKSIFEYNMKFKVFFINKDYSVISDEI